MAGSITRDSANYLVMVFLLDWMLYITYCNCKALTVLQDF